MPVFNNILAGASGATSGAAEFQIDRSLRFSSGDSAYLNRTPSSAGNRKTWTWSGWVKFTNFSTASRLFAAGANNDNRTIIHYDSSTNKLKVFSTVGGTQKANLSTDAVFRDPSSFYHIVVSFDAANTNVDIYINGVEQTLTTSTSVANENHNVNNTVAHKIGQSVDGSVQADFYLAETQLIDGQALPASDFGEYDSNSVWQPKEYSGTYGTNGFRLTFADNSSNAALGTDSSGNSNTFTVNNLTAKSPGDYDAPQNFGVVTYTGNFTDGTAISGLPFQPDFVWIKARSQAYDHMLFDSIRGAGKNLRSNLSDAEGTNANDLQSFDSNGFTVGYGGYVNGNNVTFTAWCWKAGGTASSNTDGTITSSVSANPSYGFSIVSFTGDGSGTDTIGHGLNAAPKLIILKDRDNAYDWLVYTDQIDGSWDYLKLNKTDVKSDSSYSAATSSVFSYGTDAADYIAYCFADVTGYQKIGTVTGTGSDQTVTTGFCPQYVFFKATNAAEAWLCIDRTRDPSKTSAATKFLEFNNSNAEVSNVDRIEWLDDGFKIVSDGTRIPNVSGTKYLYLAIAGVPSGEEDDSLIDTPTNYTASSGNNGGNYATINPLQTKNYSGGSPVIANGNLEIDTTGIGWSSAVGTIAVSSGQWYWEYTCSNLTGSELIRNGIYKQGGVLSGTGGDDVTSPDVYIYASNANKWTGSAFTSYGATYTTGDVIGVALDLDAGTLTFYKNGSSQGSAYTGLSGTFSPYFAQSSDPKSLVNFGARPFAHTPPTGYKSLCTQNLADPTIADGSTAFDAALWTGNGSSQSIATSFSPDFAWIKKRGGSGIARGHCLQDIVRGAGKTLESHTTSAEYDDVNAVTAFNSNGLSIGSEARVNENNGTYVGWIWDAGTSTVSNTDGSITTNVRANASAGFSIISYTGNNTSGATIGHGLNAAPEFALFKQRTVSNDWSVYHKAAGANGYVRINTTDAFTTTSGAFNNTHPSTNVITLGGDHNANGPSNTIICYAWAPVEGYSAFGSYTGNGNADGPFVYTGFKPAFILLKDTTGSTSEWYIYDTARDTENVSEQPLQASSNVAEGTSSNKFDILSNGFKSRSTGSSTNVSGSVYIYAAFGDPFKTSRAR